MQTLTNLETFINNEDLVNVLCDLLEQPSSTYLMPLIVTLCLMIHRCPIPKHTSQRLLNTIQTLKSCDRSLKQELRLLIEFADQLLHDPMDLHQTPLARETDLKALKQQTNLTEAEVRILLSACCDARLIIDYNSSLYRRRNTVQEVAWGVLSQQFDLDLEALPVVLEALLHKDAIICAAAALLLQHSKTLPPDRRLEAIQKITAVLTDEQLSRRPLEPPDRDKIW